MSVGLGFRGPARYRLRAMAEAGEAILETSVRRLLQGARRPGWTWSMEAGMRMLKKNLTTAFKMKDVEQTRLYLDSIEIRSPVMSVVSVAPVVQGEFRGSWFVPNDAGNPAILLYLHGGGYTFYPRSYAYFIALIAQTTGCRTFALDYRLAPEHRFPAQLEDALNAYRWLLARDTDPNHLIVAGDSAGGNLTLGLLLALREAKLPMPTLAIALSPPTDFVTEHIVEAELDWIDKPMLLRWADWFCDPAQRRDPVVSPLYADLHDLPPIYVQASCAEILYPSIQAFAESARDQGAHVALETWKDMGHIFQLFGPDTPQSTEALQRIKEVIDFRVKRREKESTLFETGDRMWTAQG